MFKVVLKRFNLSQRLSSFITYSLLRQVISFSLIIISSLILIWVCGRVQP